MITPIVFGAAGAVAGAAGARAGVALLSGWVLFFGGYCLANFWHCREAHCGITGPGWTALGLFGLAVAAGAPAFAWLTVNAASITFVAVLAAGYGLEWVVAARTGQRSLGYGPGRSSG